MLEVNLSGLKFPIKRPFPSKSVIMQLKEEGAKIFVGSDSHSINYFQTNITNVKKAYKFLEKHDNKKESKCSWGKDKIVIKTNNYIYCWDNEGNLF